LHVGRGVVVSNNIDHCIVLVNRDFRIHRTEVEDFLSESEDDIPEGCFLRDIDEEDAYNDAGYSAIKTPWWYGESSDSTYEFLVGEVLPMTEGYAEIVYVHENGHMQGVCVEGGNVTELDVVLSLKEPT
jgi:hypothetical protein